MRHAFVVAIFAAVCVLAGCVERPKDVERIAANKRLLGVCKEDLRRCNGAIVQFPDRLVLVHPGATGLYELNPVDLINNAAIGENYLNQIDWVALPDGPTNGPRWQEASIRFAKQFVSKDEHQ